MERIKGSLFTFDTADVIIEFLLQFVGSILLLVKVLDVIVKDLISSPIDFSHFLQNLLKQ